MEISRVWDYHCALYLMSSSYLGGVGLLCRSPPYPEDPNIIAPCFLSTVCPVTEFSPVEKPILGTHISSVSQNFHFQFELFCVKTKRFGAGCKIVILSPRARVFPHPNGEHLWWKPPISSYSKHENYDFTQSLHFFSNLYGKNLHILACGNVINWPQINSSKIVLTKVPLSDFSPCEIRFNSSQ